MAKSTLRLSQRHSSKLLSYLCFPSVPVKQTFCMTGQETPWKCASLCSSLLWQMWGTLCLAHPLSSLLSHSKVSQYKHFTCQYFYLHLYALTFFFNYYLIHVFTCIEIFTCKCFYMRCRCMAKPKLSAGVLGLKVASPIFCRSFHFVKSMLSPSLLQPFLRWTFFSDTFLSLFLVMTLTSFHIHFLMFLHFMV